MKKTKSAIKLNGRHYDADTGTLLRGEHKPVAPKSKPATAEHKKPHATSQASSRKPHHVKSHEPQHSRTLMRPAVKKPGASLKRRVKVQVVVGRSSSALIPVTQAEERVHIDKTKLVKAKRIRQSTLISRFGSPVRYGVEVAAIITPRTPRSATIASGSLTTDQLLQRAVEMANSHQQVAPKHIRSRSSKRRRFAGSVAVIAVGLSLIGLFVSNTEAPSLNAASSKQSLSTTANASTVGSVGAAAGSAAFKQASGDPSQAVSISQKPSTWNNQTLFETFVAPTSNNNYRVLTSDGQTYYAYGDQDITWVNGTTWFQLHTQTTQSDQQLLSLATRP